MKKISDADLKSRRHEILAAALNCFLHYGFKKTAMKDVADRARLSRPLLYLHFKNKVDLLKGIYEHLMEGRLQQAAEILSSKGSDAAKLEKAMAILILEPWSKVAGFPKSLEFFESCDLHNQTNYQKFESGQLRLLEQFFGDPMIAEVFTIASNASMEDLPDPKILKKRVAILIQKFT